MKIARLLPTAALLFAASYASAAAGWQPKKYVKSAYAGVYAGSDALVFSTVDVANTSIKKMYYFNLTGTEASRQQAAMILSAFYKAKQVDLLSTGTFMPGNPTWEEVIQLGVVTP